MSKKITIIALCLAAAAIAAVGFFGFRSRKAAEAGQEGAAGNAGQAAMGQAQPGAMQAGAPGANGSGSAGGQGAPGNTSGSGNAGNANGQSAQGGANGFSGAGGQGNAAGGQGNAGARGGASQGASYAMVRASHPTAGDVSVTSSLVGTVAAADVVHVYAKASGDVTAVYVSAGDYVEAGTLLCEINTDQVESAQNSLASAEVSLNNARSNLSRMQILYNGGDITDQEYEQYNNSLKTAQIQYDNAKLNYDRQVSYSSVTAPISGRIESTGVNVYDHVNNNAELLVITGEGENRIDFYVSERMMHALSVGDPVEVFKNGLEYSAALTEISTMVDPDTGMFKCRAQLDTSGEIAIGSSVKLRLVTDRATGAMLVPVDAIYYSGGEAYVYLVEDGKAVMRRVEVGLYDSEVAEIRDGLSFDDLVVGTWSSNLYEGANVRILNESEDAGSASAPSSGNASAPGHSPADNASQGKEENSKALNEQAPPSETAPADAAASGNASAPQ